MFSLFFSLVFLAIANANQIQLPSTILSPLESCIFQVGNSYFDLTSLSINDYQGSEGTYYNYKFHICGTVQNEPDCKKNGNAFCQYDSQGIFFKNCGTASSMTFETIDNGIQINYFKGDGQCPDPNTPRSSSIILTCDPQSPANPQSWVIANPTACYYTAKAKTSKACPTYVPSENKGLSGGWIFIIILIVIIPIYIVVGYVYNSKKSGTKGIRENCPQAGFWFALPGLVKDGFRFTWDKTFGRLKSGGSGESYETIK